MLFSSFKPNRYVIKKVSFFNHEKAEARDFIELAILLFLLFFAIAFIAWMQTGYQANFIQKL